MRGHEARRAGLMPEVRLAGAGVRKELGTGRVDLDRRAVLVAGPGDVRVPIGAEAGQRAAEELDQRPGDAPWVGRRDGEVMNHGRNTPSQVSCSLRLTWSSSCITGPRSENRLSPKSGPESQPAARARPVA